MTAARLTTTHNYITLSVVFDDGGNLNFTRNRRGVSMSGSEANRPLLIFLNGWLGRQYKLTIGEKMETLRAVAAKSEDLREFIKRVP
jgi:hypothetical protein